MPHHDAGTPRRRATAFGASVTLRLHEAYRLYDDYFDAATADCLRRE